MPSLELERESWDDGYFAETDVVAARQSLLKPKSFHPFYVSTSNLGMFSIASSFIQEKKRIETNWMQSPSLWVMIYTLSSIASQLINKWIAVALKADGLEMWDHMAILWQVATTILVNHFISRMNHGNDDLEMRPVTKRQLLLFFPPSILFVLMMWTLLKALETLHIANVVMGRSCCTVVIGVRFDFQ